MAIDVLHGHITKDGVKYAGIREVGLASTKIVQAATDCPAMTFARPDGRLSDPRPDMKANLLRTSFETLTSAIGDWLEMKQYVIYSPTSVTDGTSRRRVSWTDAIKALATA